MLLTNRNLKINCKNRCRTNKKNPDKKETFEYNRKLSIIIENTDSFPLFWNARIDRPCCSSRICFFFIWVFPVYALVIFPFTSFWWNCKCGSSITFLLAKKFFSVVIHFIPLLCIPRRVAFLYFFLSLYSDIRFLIILSSFVY